MAEFSRDELKTLVAQAVPPCVSLYAPMDHRGTIAYRNAIHLKDQIEQAEKLLQQMNVEKRRIESIMAPAHDFLNDKDFWNEQHEGVAVFVSAKPDSLRYYTDDSTAIRFVEKAIVANRF